MPILLLIVFLDLVGFGIVIPLLPFWGEAFGASPAVVAWLLASYSLAQLLFAPVWGRLSDRYGRRPILLVSLIGSTLSFIGLALAPSLAVLFLIRLVAGACSGTIGVTQAYVADTSPPGERGRAMGKLGAAFGLGFIIGPAIGGLLGSTPEGGASIGLPAYLGAALSALALALAWFRLAESLPPAARAQRRGPGRIAAARSVLARPALRQLIVIFFLTIFAFAGMETTFALWADRQLGFGPAEVGWTFAFVGVVLVVVQGALMGPLTKRFGEARLLLAGTVSITFGLVGLPLSGNVPAMLVASALLAGGMALTNPSISSLISRQAGSDERGLVMGVNQSAGSLARVLGPAVAGPLFDLYGRNAPYAAGAVLTAIVVALAWRQLRAGTPRPAAVQPW